MPHTMGHMFSIAYIEHINKITPIRIIGLTLAMARTNEPIPKPVIPMRNIFLMPTNGIFKLANKDNIPPPIPEIPVAQPISVGENPRAVRYTDCNGSTSHIKKLVRATLVIFTINALCCFLKKLKEFIKGHIIYFVILLTYNS